MLLGECFAGENAEVLFEAMKNDWSAEDEDTIQDLVVWVKHYKKTKTQVTGATAVWDSDLGMYLLTIPASYVPSSGSFDIVVKGSDIDDVKIRLGVNTGDAAFSLLTQGMNDIKGGDWSSADSLNGIRADIANISMTGGSGGGMGHIITDYSFDPTNNTITIEETEYTDITLERILKIKDLTTNYIIYDCDDKNYEELPIQIAGAAITYTCSNPGAASGDKIQIKVSA